MRKLRAASGLLFAMALLIGTAWGAAAPKVMLDPMDPATPVQKYVSEVFIPPAMPPAAMKKGLDYYEIAVQEFKQQMLPPGMPKTKVWGYGLPGKPDTFHTPSMTVEAQADRAVRIKWINGLVDGKGNYLSPLVPVDQTLHWANPPGAMMTMPDGKMMMKQDSHGMDPTPYMGPVPLISHLHGAHVTQESDGYPEAWFLPNAKNIPAGYFKAGSKYDQFKAEFKAKYGVVWEPGTATFQYPNDQRPTTLWFHDHTLGMTRTNVYSGIGGFYLIRGGTKDVQPGTLPGPAPKLGDPPGMKYYEVPLAIADRSFNTDGTLFFPDSRKFFDGYPGPYIPDPIEPGSTIKSDISPIHNPEFFGNTMMVNGQTWPNMNVEPRRYRMRFLNACNSRFIILKVVKDPLKETGLGGVGGRADDPAVKCWHLGSDGGFLSAPVLAKEILLGPAERADVVIDFTGVPENTELFLINRGPDEPYGGGIPGGEVWDEAAGEFPEANFATTGQVMKFKVVPLTSPDNSYPMEGLVLPGPEPLSGFANLRKVSLNELDSEVLVDADGNAIGPRTALLGTVQEVLQDNILTQVVGVPKVWNDDPTETPMLNATEVWEIYNYTMDAHPIHLHQVEFEVLERQAMTEKGIPIEGTQRWAEAWETGGKDTVIAYPGEITRLRAKFDLLGLFVWHCHIIDHEDNEMMRPLEVQAPLP